MKSYKFILLYSPIIMLLLFATNALAFNCTVATTGINFGNYDVFSPAPKDTTGSINVSCNIKAKNPKAPLAVTIALSTGSSGNFAQRQMQTTGAGQLNYNIFTNASHSSIWGDGGGSSVVQTAFITKESPFFANLYGRIPALQNSPVGSYSDVITATITW